MALDDPIAQSAWRDLFGRHAPGLILYARQWCRSHADAEDAVQEGFVRCWNSRTTIDDPAAYLFTCTKHAALDQQRGQIRRQHRETLLGSNSMPHRDACFTASIEDQEQAALIEERLNQLPREQREVLVMKLWGGLTFGQIATVLKVSPNTVASRYRYALEAMRRALPQEQAQ